MFKRKKEKKTKFNNMSKKTDLREKKQMKDKKVKFGIGFKIGRGFAILIVLTVIGMTIFYLQLNTIDQEKTQVEKSTLLEEKAHSVEMLQKDYISTSDSNYVAQIRSLIDTIAKEIENYRTIAPYKGEELDNSLRYLDDYLNAIAEYSSMQESMEMIMDMSTDR
ncbi:MAG: hypothetical protein LRZ93_03320, partial [Clostridiales bacterium]|nr:hypothetical protein [Clostridiales bacterium]